MRAAIRFLGAMMISGLATCSALWAETLEDDLVGQLRDQGYSSIRVTHTWLGRVRIDAKLDKFRREIVLNPNTGEILRDYQGAIVQITDNGEDNPAPTTGLVGGAMTKTDDMGDAKMQELTTPSEADAPRGGVE